MVFSMKYSGLLSMCPSTLGANNGIIHDKALQLSSRLASPVLASKMCQSWHVEATAQHWPKAQQRRIQFSHIPICERTGCPPGLLPHFSDVFTALRMKLVPNHKAHHRV